MASPGPESSAVLTCKCLQVQGLHCTGQGQEHHHHMQPLGLLRENGHTSHIQAVDAICNL